MRTIRQMALGICLLCAVAGIIRIFWPDNRFKPVINTVLLLYILTSVLQTGMGTDWNTIAKEIDGFNAQSPSPADWTVYQEQLGLRVSIQALETLFSQSNIPATFSWDNNTLHILLENASDAAAAQNLLEANGGSLPYLLEMKGGKQDG